MATLDYGLDVPYEVQLEHHDATSTTHMVILADQRSPGQPTTRHLLTPGVYMVSLAYNGAAAAVLQHISGSMTNAVSVPAGTAGTPRSSSPMKISVQGADEYLHVAAPSTGGSARATISVIPAATFDEMAESAQGVSVLAEIDNLKKSKADKTTVDAITARLDGRASITWSYEGTGTPVLSSYPGIKIGDYIVRKSDGQEWRVDE